MKKPLIAANWKLNNTVEESLHFATALSGELKAVGNTDVVIIPPFTALYSLGIALTETDYKLGAQNLYWEDNGAFTGEVSAPLLKNVGCSYVVLGHSERRHVFGDTNENVHKRVLAALSAELIPILCVGEKLEEREADKTWEIIEEQLQTGLKGVELSAPLKLAIAYEPVWAIGTGKTATPEQAQEVHAMIRAWLTKRFDKTTAAGLRVIYGGSVKPENAAALLKQNDIDGALVGGASLDVSSFAAIIRSLT